STNLFAHPKTLKLERRLGAAGVMALIRLWTWAAVTCPSGLLKRLDAEDIALAAGWRGDADLFVATLVDLGWLNMLEDGSLALHDWAAHQDRASRAAERSERARKAALSRWARARDRTGDSSGERAGDRSGRVAA
ncbi:MAG: hypothetical protein Q4F72_10770, partial [Desulfovibrionaceae bacterium]|nr:hypothetical protein [Desulfovibrionaceae bacterium]